MAGVIRKEAKIVDIKESVLVLEMCSMEACQMCAAKSVCGNEKSGDTKRIELLHDGLPRQIGDNVTLCISTSVGLKGAFIAYFLPIIVLFAFIILMQRVCQNDFVTGISALGVLIVYFVLLWALRKKIEKQISIKIE